MTSDHVAAKRLDAKRAKAAKLEEENEATFEALNAKLAEYHAPPQTMDVSGMRLELLIETLKGLPQFEEAILDFEIACHTKIETALEERWVDLRKAIEEYDKKKNGLSVVKKPDTLLGPTGQPIKST